MMRDCWVKVEDDLPVMMAESNWRSDAVLATDGKFYWVTHYHVTAERWCSGAPTWAGELTHWQYIILP